MVANGHLVRMSYDSIMFIIANDNSNVLSNSHIFSSDPSSPLNHEFKKMNTAKIENYKSLYTKKNAVLLFEQCCNLHGVDKEKTKSSLGFIE